MTVEQIEEKLIILLAQDVDHHFEQFARHFTPLLFQWERSKYSDTSELDTEEIVSETLIKAYHALKSYSEERIRNIKIRAWLSTILRNTSFNHRRTKWGKQPSIPIDSLINHEENDEKDEIPNKTTLEDESILNEELREVLAEISIYISSHAKPERNRKIAEMVLLEGHTLEEAAKEVGVSSAVASYVIRTLRQHLEEKYKAELSRQED